MLEFIGGFILLMIFLYGVAGIADRIDKNNDDNN
jgi:hypothetical protein